MKTNPHCCTDEARESGFFLCLLPSAFIAAATLLPPQKKRGLAYR